MEALRTTTQSSPPVKSSNGHHAPDPVTEPEFVAVIDAVESQAARARVMPMQTADPAQEIPASDIPDVREILRRRPRSLSMWWRYLRTLWFFAWLFVRLLFWHKLVQNYFPGMVDRGNLKRWTGYAREFRHFALSTGGVMIKAGQFVSTRSDILPEQITNELASLRDEVPGVPVNKVRDIITQDLGPIPSRYARFDEQAVAAASLGQVHRAQLHNGDRVVVKILRPGIEEICHTDLAAMNIVGHVAMRFKFISRRMDVVSLITEFGQVLLEELSYRQEARNAARFTEMFRHDLGVYVPRIYNEHSSDRVLTIEDVTSIKLDDYAALERAGISRKAVAKRLMDTYLKQIFQERFFHADPHPGNLFVYPLPDDVAKRPEYAKLNSEGGRPFYLIFIDFGMTGGLRPELVDGLVGTISSVFTRDSKGLISAYSKLGFLLPGADTDRLEEAVQTVFNQVWGLSMEQMKEMSFDSMSMMGQQFSDLLYTMPFQVPQDFIYLGRTVSILSGMTTALDPAINPWSELAPYAQQLSAMTSKDGKPVVPIGGLLSGALSNAPFLQNLFSGSGGQALVGLAQNIFGRTNPTALLEKIDKGEIKVKVDATGQMKGQLFRLEMQQRKTTRAVLVAGMLVASTLFYTGGDTALALVGYGITAITYLFGIAWSDPT